MAAGTCGEMVMVALALRLEQIRLVIPKQLAGTIQFEIARTAEGPFTFHVQLAGARSVIQSRSAEKYESVVCAHETTLSSILRSADSEARIDVWGDHELVSRFLFLLSSTPQAQNLIGIRSVK